MGIEKDSKAPAKGGWRAQLVQVAAIVLIVFVGKGALAEQFYVPSGSMEPTLLIGDTLLASKFAYGYSGASLPFQITPPATGRLFGATPKRGDIVVFRSPADRAQAWVKRVIGLPGDRIQMRQGLLFINGTPATLMPDGIGIGAAEEEDGSGQPARRYIETLPGGVAHTIFKTQDNARFDNTPEVRVPADRLFVMGDNRDHSADSRVPIREGGVGLLPMDNLVGRVDVILGSWDLGIRNQPVWTWPSGLRIARFFTAVR